MPSNLGVNRAAFSVLGNCIRNLRPQNSEKEPTVRPRIFQEGRQAIPSIDLFFCLSINVSTNLCIYLYIYSAIYVGFTTLGARVICRYAVYVCILYIYMHICIYFYIYIYIYLNTYVVSTHPLSLLSSSCLTTTC